MTMECFLKRVLLNGGDDESHRYFVRFGKGNYRRRFLLSAAKTKKIKVKASFEMANDFVEFVNENFKVSFSGKILSKASIQGRAGKKKSGTFVYEVKDCKLDDYSGAYYYLLDAESSDLKLRIKKALPKPGKDAEKVDDGFCLMELPLESWEKVKNSFFWDVPECKKCSVEHELIITDIVFPKDEKDPVKIRELSKRKGIIKREIEFDDKKQVKEYPVEA